MSCGIDFLLEYGEYFQFLILTSKQLILTNFSGELEVSEKNFLYQEKPKFWISGDASAFFGSLTVVFSLFAESTSSEIPSDLC